MAKNGKQQRRINARKQARLQKAANNTRKSNTTTEQRASKRQVSTAGVKWIKDFANACKPFELSIGQRYKTYALMMLDDAVWASFDSRATAIERAQHNGKLKYKKDSEKSKEAKEFLEYCLKHMDSQTTRSIGRSCAEMIKNGSAPHEMVLRRGTGKYESSWTIKKLAFIDPSTLDTVKPFPHSGICPNPIVSDHSDLIGFGGVHRILFTNTE